MADRHITINSIAIVSDSFIPLARDLALAPDTDV